MRCRVLVAKSSTLYKSSSSPPKVDNITKMSFDVERHDHPNAVITCLLSVQKVREVIIQQGDDLVKLKKLKWSVAVSSVTLPIHGKQERLRASVNILGRGIA